MSRVDRSDLPQCAGPSTICYRSLATASLRIPDVITALHRPASCAGTSLGRGGDFRLLLESVAGAGHGLDVARRAPLVVELHAQLADVTIDDIALDLELAAPDRREQVLAAQGLAGVGRQEIEERLLDGREVKGAAAHAHALLDQVDLETVELDPRHDRDGHTVCPPQERKGSSDDLVQRERHLE